MFDRRLLLVPIIAAALHGCADGASGSRGSQGSNFGAGAFTLAPGDSLTLRVNSSYHTIRICNNLGSAGTMVGAIGDYPAIKMAPGVCNATMGQTGDHITLRNISDGTVSGIYQSAGNRPKTG